jgi:hypothetical protein
LREFSQVLRRKQIDTWLAITCPALKASRSAAAADSRTKVVENNAQKLHGQDVVQD